MEHVHYITLAAARTANQEKFDEKITKAVFAAAASVGVETVVKALCGPSRRNAVERPILKVA